MLQEEASRSLEEIVSKEGSDPLELRSNCIVRACVKRRALSRISWVELQEFVHLGVCGVREE